MPGSEDALNALRDAVRLSPENTALRMHYAQTLLSFNRAEEAEREYAGIVKAQPTNAKAKLGLIKAYHNLNKTSHAMVVVEDLIRTDDPPAETYLLYARLLLQDGRDDEAARQYRRAVNLDPALADPVLAEQLEVPTSSEFGDPCEGDVTSDGRVRMRREGFEDSPDFEIVRPKIDFKDVGGMDSLKDEIRMKIIHPLTHPEIYEAYGKKIGGGILMYGPPGCGKTHLARATAGEVKAGFLAIGIHDVLDMYIGNSEQRLHELFQQARRHKPCVLFFDEVDALGASRTDMKHSGGRLLINQFLSELDGVQESNEGILILAATNAPWHLDSAFRRPGRFDRVLFVPPPDVTARAEILKILLRDKPSKDIDYAYLAKGAKDFSGADMKAVVDLCIEQKLKEAMSQGTPMPLMTRDLQAAAKRLNPTTQEWFATARNYALYSNQSGVYDDILKYLKIK